MKKIFIGLALLFFALSTYSQKAEIRIIAGSGLFYYRGSSVLQHTNYYISDFYIFPSFGGPGAIPGASIFTELDIKKRFRENLFWGMNFQAQRLTSKSKIDSIIYVPDLGPDRAIKANGHASLTGVFAATDLYIGRRIRTKNIFIDISGGSELSLQFSNNENFFVNSSNSSQYYDYSSLGNNQFDLRLFISTDFIYKKFSFDVGYFYGIENYYGYQPGDNSKAYSRHLKIGLGYRIK